jgi:transposase
MSISAFLPGPTHLQLDRLISDRNGIILLVRTTRPEAACPLCGHVSTRVHSRYERTIHDLPWQGIAVRLRLSTRRFFCLNPDCERVIFTERLPALVAPYARRTKRLQEALYLIGYALGGEAGAQLAVSLGMTVSPDTLLRRIRETVAAPTPVPRVLGVDDWAFCKGHCYGTILVDLERRDLVDLLPDRSSESGAAWLKAHPNIELISRDRAEAYAVGARQGAPQAIQIADRWHLLKNLGDAVERFLMRHHSSVREAAKRAVSSLTSPEQDRTAINESLPRCSELVTQDARECAWRREQRLERYTQVIELFGKGLTINQIGETTGLDRKTVRKWIKANSFPERTARRRRARKLDSFVDYLRRRWDEGCHNVAQLRREITAQGYDGCSSVLRDYLAKWRARLPEDQRRTSGPRRSRWPKLTVPSPRSARWLLLKDPDESDPRKEGFHQRFLESLLEVCPEARRIRELAQRFWEMVRERRAGELRAWLMAVFQSKWPELESFAKGLIADKEAVMAALSYEWSNGPVEGQIHRLKLIKRSMYGRANFDLLRARVLPPVIATAT